MDLQKIERELYKEWRRLTVQTELIDKVIYELASLRYGRKTGKKRRKMSAAGRAKIAAAQRARWAKQKKSQK